MDVNGLYQMHYAELLRFVRRICRDESRAEDAVQEAFLRAMRHADTLEGLSPPQRRAWLYKAARSCAVDEIRRASHLPVERQEESAVDDLSGPWMEEALSTLPETSRELVRLRYLEGFTSAQIGAASGLPAPTVRTRLRAALKQLKRYCDEEEPS